MVSYSDSLGQAFGKVYEIPLRTDCWTEVYKSATFSNLGKMFGGGTGTSGEVMLLQPVNATVTNYESAKANPGKGYGGLAAAMLPKPVQNFPLIVHGLTMKQLRPPTAYNFFDGKGPSAFEVLWICFNFQFIDGKKLSNYFMIKKSADPLYKLELGYMCSTTDSDAPQTILKSVADWGAPVADLDPMHLNVVVIEKVGPKISVAINGVKRMTYNSENVSPQWQQCPAPAGSPVGSILNVPGTFAMYCEDAQVLVTRVCYQELNSVGNVVSPT